MSKLPGNLKYAKSHEWARQESDGTITVGITDHAQDLMGDMVYVELPEVGRTLTAGKECAVVESVKAASDVYAPIAGVVTAVNDSLSGSPEIVNKDPYGEGWMFRLKATNAAELGSLLDAKAYEALLAAEKH
jgi:glycine cleavage system H protein